MHHRATGSVPAAEYSAPSVSMVPMVRNRAKSQFSSSSSKLERAEEMPSPCRMRTNARRLLRFQATSRIAPSLDTAGPGHESDAGSRNSGSRRSLLSSRGISPAMRLIRASRIFPESSSVEIS